MTPRWCSSLEVCVKTKQNKFRYVPPPNAVAMLKHFFFIFLLSGYQSKVPPLGYRMICSRAASSRYLQLHPQRKCSCACEYCPTLLEKRGMQRSPLLWFWPGNIEAFESLHGIICSRLCLICSHAVLFVNRIFGKPSFLFTVSYFHS